jgi:hypothetical protein
VLVLGALVVFLAGWGVAPPPRATPDF